MANTKNIIDMEGLYRAGYNSRIDAKNQDKDRRVALIDQLFMKAGSYVIDRYKQNHAELKGLKTLGRASNSQIQMEIEKLGGQLTPKMQASLDVYKAEYDKGARMSTKGLTRKRKNEGQLMMDMAFHKMNTMKKGLLAVQEQMQKQVDNGMIELGEKPFNDTAVTGWNAGATEPEFTNGVRLANGTMLENLSIDDETGEIYYMSQAEADTSEEAYEKAMNELGGEGVEDNQMPSYEDWASQQEAPELEATLFSRVKFPGEQDNSLQDGYMDLLTKHEQSGLDGFEIDQESTSKLKMELNGRFSNANENQVRSFLFGGQVTMVNDNGELTRVTPAYKLLVDGGAEPGNAQGTAEEQAQYAKFQGLLEQMKGEDFSKGSPRRVELVDMVSESVEGYQNNAYGKYLQKEDKANERRNNNGSGRGDNDSQYGNWDDGTTGRRMFNKEWLYPNDFKRRVQPTIDALNSSEDNIPELNTMKGTAIKKEDGTWYWWNSGGGDGSGAWVESDRNYIARGNNVISYLKKMEEVSGGKTVELQPTQYNTLQNLESNYPAGDVEIPYDKNTYAIVPAAEGKNKGKMVAVTKREWGDLMQLHYGKNKEYVRELAAGKTNFSNFKFNLKGALKGDKKALLRLNIIE